MMVEMADMTTKAPRGILENVLVQIYMFIFLVDFVIMDMVEDPNAPLILGRPLLETAHAHIDIFNKDISIGVGEERNLFKINELVDDLFITHESFCSHSKEREFEVTSTQIHVVRSLELSRDFTRPLEPPSGLKALLYMLNATVIPMKLVQVDAHGVVLGLYLDIGKHFKSGLVGYHADNDDGLELWMLLIEADLNHGLEHVVSSSSRANP
nr:hypothetical protein [Tanacetum cinerariifolium]